MSKIHQLLLAVGGIVTAIAGTWYMTASPSTPNAFTPPAYSTPAYASSGKTAQETLAAGVRGNVFTFTCAGGITAQNGALTILNSAHYKDAANVSCVFPTSLLPAGAQPASLKGRLIEATGSLSDYKGKPQWSATSITIK